jgi:DNA (cytosine-5)-methyltransferase 1
MLNCVDLFSGAGGFSLAAAQAGLEVRLAAENDPHAVLTYTHNLCQGTRVPLIINEDINGIDAKAAFVNTYRDNEICDLMLGGPPCQGFSTHRIKDAGVGDERNDLIHVYFNFVRAFSPSVFLLENVPGMLWERHEAALNRFYIEGAKAGYDVQEPVVLDARDFGLPQRRKRVFILGIRSELNTADFEWPPRPTHGSTAARLDNADLLPWLSCARVFEPAKAGDRNHVHMSHGTELVEAFRNTPPNGGSRKDSGRTLPCHQAHDGHKDVYGRIDPAQPAPTMTTACINPSKGRFVHPTEHHGITARQAARIQTFPDTFEFFGGLMAAGTQIGNAVPPALGRHLVRHILPLLEKGRVAPIDHGIQNAAPQAQQAEAA